MSGSVSSSMTGSASNIAWYHGTLTERSRTVRATWVRAGNVAIVPTFRWWFCCAFMKKAPDQRQSPSSGLCRSSPLASELGAIQVVNHKSPLGNEVEAHGDAARDL